MTEDGFIMCDCCGTEKLAQVRGDTLIIKDRRHGRTHMAVVKLQDLLDNEPEKGDNTSKDKVAEAAEL